MVTIIFLISLFKLTNQYICGGEALFGIVDVDAIAAAVYGGLGIIRERARLAHS